MCDAKTKVKGREAWEVTSAKCLNLIGKKHWL